MPEDPIIYVSIRLDHDWRSAPPPPSALTAADSMLGISSWTEHMGLGWSAEGPLAAIASPRRARSRGVAPDLIDSEQP